MAKAKESSESKSKFQEAMDKLNKAYGVGTVLALDSKTEGKYDVISSGSLGFDWITLGVGGFVKGRMYELMGWEGTGKSTICGHIAAECQKQGGRVLYIDGEHAVDKNYFQALGVDTTKLLIAQPSCGEEGFNIAMEKLKTALSIHNVCVVVISQYREKIGVMFGNPTTTQGGHALKFYSDCRVEVSRSLAKEGDVTYGNLTKVKATKNKMCPPYRKAEFEIVYGQGIDKVGEILSLMNEYEVGRKYGKTMTFNDTKYDLEEFKQMLLDNEEFYNQIRDSIVIKIKEADLNPEENVESEI